MHDTTRLHAVTHRVSRTVVCLLHTVALNAHAPSARGVNARALNQECVAMRTRRDDTAATIPFCEYQRANGTTASAPRCVAVARGECKRTRTTRTRRERTRALSQMPRVPSHTARTRCTHGVAAPTPSAHTRRHRSSHLRSAPPTPRRLTQRAHAHAPPPPHVAACTVRVCTHRQRWHRAQCAHTVTTAHSRRTVAAPSAARTVTARNGTRDAVCTQSLCATIIARGVRAHGNEWSEYAHGVCACERRIALCTRRFDGATVRCAVPSRG
jgi:hypothetical protein